MKKILNKIVALSLLAVPGMAGAQSGLAVSASGGDFGNILVDILAISNNILIPFILGIGFLVFVWGMFRFFIVGGANDDEKEKGKSLMVYATLGFVLIIVFWGVINLIASSTGLDDDSGINDFNNNSLKNIDITPISGSAG
jgi:uncharacterized membrane protein YidH (DUF202 family)